MKQWQKEAIELAETGISWRQVARELEIPRTTVSDYLRKHFKGYIRPADRDTRKHKGIENKPCVGSVSGLHKPKILTVDIETAPLSAAVWSMWKNNVGVNQIQRDWFMLSFCAKWYGNDDIIYMDQRHAKDVEDDFPLLEALYGVLDDCDILVGQNVASFDNKKINTRLILNGLPKPSPYRIIDTLDIAKRIFGFPSNKLEYLTKVLTPNTIKSKHNKFPGYELWAECLEGNIEAFEEMEEYNIQDVISTEELFTVLAPWDNRLPNLDLYDIDDVNIEDWVKDGYAYTNLSKFQRYRNIHTGQYKRGRTNLLTKEQRKKILANII